jgi:YlmC/YmxH family sporulation protein
VRCRIADLRCKEVVNICDGFRMGFVCDVIMDVLSGQIHALVVPGPCKFFGLFGHEDDYIIPWDAIRKIGDDIILIEVPGEHPREKRPKKPWF